jgi:hypothetical protein
MPATKDPDLTIPSRFCGPARSGNGGYTAGTLAERVPHQESRPFVEVTLRRPPPLEVPMAVRQLSADDPDNLGGLPLTVLLLGEARVAEARAVDDDTAPVEAVSAGLAADAMSRFPGLASHPFPTCFACGVGREEGDGLRIFPGPVGSGRVASLWVPHESLAESTDLLDQQEERVGAGTAWAALDCVGGWAGDMDERKMVLGRITARVDALPVVGEPHVVMGEARGQEGRKTFTASTLYDSDGRIVARAAHVWVAVDPDSFN